MTLPMNFWLLFGVCMLVSAIGFKNYVWFISLGYGFSIAAEGLAMLILYGDTLSLGTVLCCLLFVIYGLRLGGYLAIRELGSSSYKKNMKGEIKEGKDVPMGVKIAIWVTCALLYVTQISGVFYRMHNAAQDNALVFVGAAIMLLGVSLETAADIQKNNAKKVNPRRFVDTGLYGVVRCPNYLGELLLWLGVFITGIPALRGVWQWVLAILGFVLITWVMFSGARRLEIRQDRNYGSDPAYQEYVRTVPIIIPFIPLYSVEKHKWLVA